MSLMEAGGQPVSRTGSDLANILQGRGAWILFAPTGGDGATPFAGLVVLDSSYRGEGKAASAAATGLVAHELTHVLQRDRGDPEYWPNGYLHPDPRTRWLFDSTNYMETLAYIVGSVIEHDLESRRLRATGLAETARGQIRAKLRELEAHLATLTGIDAKNATRYVLRFGPTNTYYIQNYRRELASRDGRVPSGGWDHWLKELGFSAESVTEIRAIARKGNARKVSVDEADRLVGHRENSTIHLRLSGLVPALTLLYLGLRSWLLANWAPMRPSESSRLVVDWVSWFLLGVLVRIYSDASHRLYRQETRPGSPRLDLPVAILVGGLTAILLVVAVEGSLMFVMDAGFGGAEVDFHAPRADVFVLPAFWLGAFHRLPAEAAKRAIRWARDRTRSSTGPFATWWKRLRRGV